MELLYSSSVSVRFAEDGLSVYVWTPYSEKFIADLKQTFNSLEALGDAYVLDPGAEWDKTLKCWHIYTGWHDCEDWLDKLIALLNQHFPDCSH